MLWLGELLPPVISCYALLQTSTLWTGIPVWLLNHLWAAVSWPSNVHSLHLSYRLCLYISIWFRFFPSKCNCCLKCVYVMLYKAFSSSQHTTHPAISIFYLRIGLLLPKYSTLNLPLLKCLHLFSDYFFKLSRPFWILIFSNVPAVPHRLMPPSNLIIMFSFHHLSH